MTSLKSQLKRIVDGMKNPNPDIRMDAIDDLENIIESENIEVNLLTLDWLAKEAAYPYANPVKDWDEPSFHLINFITHFRIPELVDSLVTYYPNYSLPAKEEVIRYLCSFNDSKSEMAILDMIENDLVKKEAVFPLDVLLEDPVLVMKILDKYYKYLEDEMYKSVFYKLLSYCLDNDLVNQYKSSYIFPLLLSDYQKQKERYLKYQDNYNPKFVYGSWKNTYFEVRSNMCTYLSLMEYYFTDKTASLVKEATAFVDPVIRLSSIITSLQRNIHVDKDILTECATSMETSEFFYYELLRIHKEHLFPIKEKKQHYFAKSHLFTYVTTEFDFLPEKIVIVEEVNIENKYKQPIRYYLASIEHDGGTKIPAWVGAYALEDDNDTIRMRDGTYLEKGKFEDHTVQEFIQLFMGNREQEQAEDDSEIHFTSKPRFTNWFYLWYVVLAVRGYRAFSTLDPVYITFTTLFASLVVGYHVYRIKQTKERAVEIMGSVLRYTELDTHSEIQLHEIKRITLQKASFKTRFFNRHAKVVAVYNKENNIALEFPLHCVDYDEFSYYIEQLTNHLQETPYIEAS